MLTKLFPPALPVGSAAGIACRTVKLQLSIRQGGTLADVLALRGPSILKEAAVESAQKSQFDRGQWESAIAPYHLSYKFELPGQLSGTGDQCRQTPVHHNPEVTYFGPASYLVFRLSGVCRLPSVLRHHESGAAKCFISGNASSIRCIASELGLAPF